MEKQRMDSGESFVTLREVKPKFQSLIFSKLIDII